jgi:transcriptional regulator with XRE-family HTH domain
VASKSNSRVVLGAAIRKNRKRLGVTQQVLAEKSELTPNYIGLVERGEEQVSLPSLELIAKALGVRVRELVKDI